MVLTKYQSPNQRVKRQSPSKESPSRQLHHELEHALEQLVLHEHERKKLHAYQRRTHQEELEARDLALAKSHMAALDAASARHDAVRQEAEAVLHRHLREQEEERKRKEAEEWARQEREAREKAERERRAREDAERKAREERERQEAEEAKARKAVEDKANAEREEADRKEKAATAQREQAAQAERARRAKEDADKEAAAKALADKEAADRQKEEQVKLQAQKANQSVNTAAGLYSASSNAETRHREYLALHKKLKVFRKEFWEQAKKDKAFKAAIGDMRRAMRTSVGQLTDDKVGNKKAQERVKSCLMKALNEVPSPPIAANEFLPPHLHLPDNSTQIPGLVIYLLSIFSKAIVAAFCAEVAVNPRAAEPIGTLTAQVFSMPELSIAPPGGSSRGSLIPILMSKFHASVPILFGVSGPENTAEGRLRLGWRREGEGSQKTFVIEQRHHERMTGLGAGYAAIALRNFSKTKLSNPYPPTHFWESLSYILNTPPQFVTTSHVLLVKSMLDNNACDRFVLFFGNAAIAALREALVNWPRSLPEKIQGSAAAKSIGLMVDQFAKEKHLRFD